MTATQAPGVRIESIIFNTTDARRLADFWAELLSLSEDSAYEDEFIWLSPLSAGGPKLGFQKVGAPSPGPRRLHLDLSGDDPALLLQRSLDLGAVVHERHSTPEFTWTVLKDPDGNEFCIAEV